MQVNLSSGNYDVLDSRQVFLFSETENLKMELTGEDGNGIAVVLQFYQDESGNQKITSEVKEDTLLLSCLNFNDLGTGLKQPMEIATIDNKKLYLMFWSYLEGKSAEKSRSVKYTIFCEK